MSDDPYNRKKTDDIEDNSDSSQAYPHLIRSLGLTDIVMMGIAAMIGGSIFVLTGPAIGLAGSAVIIAFIINAIITTFTAMSYAELGSAMPEAGGGYLWIRKGLPRPNAFISGWLAWFAHIVAGSLYALSFGSFLFGLIEMANIPLISEEIFGIISSDKIIAIISIITFTYINIKGASVTGKTGTIVTLFQIGTIVLLICTGIWFISDQPNWQSNFSDFVPLGIPGIIAAMGLTFIIFEGYEIIVQTGEEVKNPRRNIPKAIFISLAIVVVMYCLIAFVAIAGTPSQANGVPSWKFIGDNGELGIMKAFDSFLPYGAFIVLGAGLVSTLAALNATTFSSARVAFAMGRHYNLPPQLSSVHHKNKTPYIATAISAIIMALMAYALPLDQVAVAAGVIFLLLFTQVNLAVISIRKIYGDKLHYGFKIPLFPFIPITGIFLNLGLAVYLLITQPLSWGITALWVLVGFALYRMYTFKKEVDHYAPIVTSEGDLTRSHFRILVPYTPENPDRLIRYPINIAKATEGEINILRTITVPHQTPLSAGVAFSDSAKKSFSSLEEIIEKENIRNHYLVRISHDFTEAILATIEEQKINVMIIDYEALRNSKKLQALVTCDILAVNTAGNDDFLFQAYSKNINDNVKVASGIKQKYKLIIIHDNKHESDLVFKTLSWLEASNSFNINILSLSKKNQFQNINMYDDNNFSKPKQLEYFNDIQYDLNEIYLTEEIENSPEKLSDLLLSAINALEPDIIITNYEISKFNFFSSIHLLGLIDQLNCPIIVTKDFSIPGVHSAKHWLTKIFNHEKKT